MVAKNIQWDVDWDEIFEMINLDIFSKRKAIEAFQIPIKKFLTMSSEELEEYIYDKCRCDPILLNDFLGLPDEIEIPDEIIDEEDISDYLSNVTGYCHRGFYLE